MKPRKWLPTLGLLAFGMLLGLPFLPSENDRENPLVGQPFPLEQVRALAQDAPLVVNVFASWCEPCKAEHPLLMAMQKDGVKIIGIPWGDTEEKINAFLAEAGDPFLTLINDPQRKLTSALGLRGIPTSYIVDRQGVIRWVWAGPLDSLSVHDRVYPTLQALAAEKQAP